MIDLDAQVHLADLRLRVLNGDKLSPEEYRDLFLDLRRGRDMAAAATAAAATRARKLSATPTKQPKIDIRALFGGTPPLQGEAALAAILDEEDPQEPQP